MTRFGTWNLEGKQSADHKAFLQGLECEVLLLTEVPSGFSLGDRPVVFSSGLMLPGKHFAAVVGASDSALKVNASSAAGQWQGIDVISTVLPWRGAQEDSFGKDLTAKVDLGAERTRRGPAVSGNDLGW